MLSGAGRLHDRGAGVLLQQLGGDRNGDGGG
jgi:hypothetical protein